MLSDSQTFCPRAASSLMKARMAPSTMGIVSSNILSTASSGRSDVPLM